MGVYHSDLSEIFKTPNPQQTKNGAVEIFVNFRTNSYVFLLLSYCYFMGPTAHLPSTIF